MSALAPLPIEAQPWKINDLSAAGYRHEQWIYKFTNGFGASVVIGDHTYGGKEGLYEIAVLKFDGHESTLTYDTPITNDVLGWQSLEDVAGVLVAVAAL